VQLEQWPRDWKCLLVSLALSITTLAQNPPQPKTSQEAIPVTTSWRSRSAGACMCEMFDMTTKKLVETLGFRWPTQIRFTLSSTAKDIFIYGNYPIMNIYDAATLTHKKLPVNPGAGCWKQGTKQNWRSSFSRRS
jgi:hypothetical protein